MKKIEREYFAGKSAPDIAKLLLGKFLVKITGKGVIVARILETEAYYGTSDKASSAYGGNRMAENNVIYGEPGFLYVYNVGKLYAALGIVVCDVDNPSYVIIRRVEVLEGFDAASVNRFDKRYDELSEAEKNELGSSSSRVRALFGVTFEDNGLDLCSASSNMYLCHDDTVSKMFKIQEAKRLGVEFAEEYKDKLWRFIYE